MEAKAATVDPAEQNQNPFFCLTFLENFGTSAEAAAAAAPSATVTGTEVRFGDQPQQNQTRTDCFNGTKFGQCFRPWRTT